MSELRAYFFQNMYVSGIHAGIQTQHTTAEMFVKHRPVGSGGLLLYNWATYYKTTIILNGGDYYSMYEILDLFNKPENPFPWAHFKEEGLGGLITNIGIILPEEIYAWEPKAPEDTMDRIIYNRGEPENIWKYELSKKLKTFSLMR